MSTPHEHDAAAERTGGGPSGAPDGRTAGWAGTPRRDATAVPDAEARAALAASAVAGADHAATAPGATALGTTDGRVHGRPAPQYGEYAPAGWVNPVVVEEQRREQERAAAGATGTAGAGTAGPGTAGERGTRPGRASSPTAAGRVEHTQTDRPTPGGPTTLPGWRFGKTPVDLLLTLVLLAMGLVSVVQALSVGAVASAVREELELRYTTLADPGSLTGAATISAGGLLVLFAVVVWWSVVRLRATKRTFWVPLVGGAVATLFSSVVFLVVVFQDSHFVAVMMQQATGG
jgi:hypothetical protein